MTPMEKFYLQMGFLDCLEISARAAPHPEQAIMKRMYVQEKMIPDTLPGVPKEEILSRIDEIVAAKIGHELITKYIGPKVETDKMMDILKKGQFTSYKDLI